MNKINSCASFVTVNPQVAVEASSSVVVPSRSFSLFGGWPILCSPKFTYEIRRHVEEYYTKRKLSTWSIKRGWPIPLPCKGRRVLSDEEPTGTPPWLGAFALRHGQLSPPPASTEPRVAPATNSPPR